jgi:hypothetical protein
MDASSAGIAPLSALLLKSNVSNAVNRPISVGIEHTSEPDEKSMFRKYVNCPMLLGMV